MILCRFKVCGVRPITKRTNASLRWHDSLNLAPVKQSQRLHAVDLNKDREQGVQNARLDIFSLPSIGSSDRRIQLECLPVFSGAQSDYAPSPWWTLQAIIEVSSTICTKKKFRCLRRWQLL
jgi:hypothetical protein